MTIVRWGRIDGTFPKTRAVGYRWLPLAATLLITLSGHECDTFLFCPLYFRLW